jgi:hypothetical protein
MNPRNATPRHTPVRPPQAVSAAPHSPAQPGVTYSPNAALLIDFDNVTMGIRSDLQSELRHLFTSDIIKGKVQLRRAYADWRRYPQYVAPLAEASIDMIMAPAYGSSKKNATDIRLAIDALELVFTRPEIGTYILLSGDSDFSTLVIKLKEYGKYVIGVGIRESSSDLLVMNCDEYYSYNALAGLVRSGSDEAGGGARRDPWELVTEALVRMQRNGDVMRADRLKQVMQDIDSTFDEKNLGMSKFSRFVTEAASKGLLSLTKLETGQLEVGPPRAKPNELQMPARPGESSRDIAADLSPSGEPVAAAASSEERPERPERSGRRRGRGRGRDRDRGPRDSGAVPVAITAPVVVPAPIPVREKERVSDGIGASGERLTRDEALGLVRQAVQALATDDRPARASAVRAKTRELLGRDSASLSLENFARILRDAHDADMIDLRRRGDDYEVAPAVTAAPVAEQLNVAAAAARSAEVAATPSAPAVPRGMAPRGSGLGRRGFTGRGSAGAPPPDLLSVGVVDVPSAATTVPVDEVVELTLEAPDADVAAPKRGRGRAVRAPRAKRAVAADTAADVPAAKKATRSRAKKTTTRGADA